MRYAVAYTFVGLLGGCLYSLIGALKSNVAINLELLLICGAMGGLGGLIPGIIRESIRKQIPLLQSWFVLVLLIFLTEALTSHSHNLRAFVYGYISHLLWEGYRHSLRKF